MVVPLVRLPQAALGRGCLVIAKVLQSCTFQELANDQLCSFHNDSCSYCIPNSNRLCHTICIVEGFCYEKENACLRGQRMLGIPIRVSVESWVIKIEFTCIQDKDR